MFKRTAAITGVLLFIAGCTVHRTQQASLSIEPPSFFESMPEAREATVVMDHPPAHWWRIFNDDELNRLMEKTFSANLALDKAAARVVQAMALERQSTARQRPDVDVSASAGRSRQIGTTGTATGSTTHLSVAATYEVDLWNKLESRARSQGFETAAARMDLNTLYLTLSAQVAENYFVMVEQRARLDLIDQTIAARKANLELVENRFREGVVSALDLYQARQNLAAARSQRPAVVQQLAVAAHALSVLTGGYPTDKIGGQLAQLPDMPELFPAGLPSTLLTRRPDIAAARLRLSAADQLIGAAVADRFPSINLIADYGYAGNDYGTHLSDTIWDLVANMALPLIDWQRRKAEVDRTRAVFAERLSDYRSTVLTAFQEVEDALVAYRATMESIRRIDLEVKAAENTMRLSNARYLDGLSDYLPVLTAQATYFDSQTRLLSARRQLISAQISLARAVGGDWMVDTADQRIEKTAHFERKQG